eukprot:Gb_29053 [translate_table: standard]
MEVLRGAWVGIVCLYHISQSAQSHMEKEGISLLFTGKNNLFSLGFQRMQKQKGTRKAWRQNGLTLSNVLKPEKGLVGELAQMEQVVGELDQELAQRQALQAVIEQCEKALKLLKPNSSEGDLGIRLKDSQSDEYPDVGIGAYIISTSDDPTRVGRNLSAHQNASVGSLIRKAGSIFISQHVEHELSASLIRLSIDAF